MRLTDEEKKMMEQPLPLKARKIGARVVLVDYKGPKFPDNLYQQTTGILINGGRVHNLEGETVDYLQARIDALLRENARLKNLLK